MASTVTAPSPDTTTDVLLESVAAVHELPVSRKRVIATREVVRLGRAN